MSIYNKYGLIGGAIGTIAIVNILLLQNSINDNGKLIKTKQYLDKFQDSSSLSASEVLRDCVETKICAAELNVDVSSLQEENILLEEIRKENERVTKLLTEAILEKNADPFYEIDISGYEGYEKLSAFAYAEINDLCGELTLKRNVQEQQHVEGVQKFNISQFISAKGFLHGCKVGLEEALLHYYNITHDEF